MNKIIGLVWSALIIFIIARESPEKAIITSISMVLIFLGWLYLSRKDHDRSYVKVSTPTKRSSHDKSNLTVDYPEKNNQSYSSGDGCD